jgi:hypothetical protein
MTELYILLTTDEECTREIDPTDSWDAGDYHCSLSKLEVFLKKPQYYTKSFTVDFKVNVGDNVVVLLEQYGSGNTFGCTTGYLSAKGIYHTETEALKASALMPKTDDYFGGHEEWRTEHRVVLV